MDRLPDQVVNKVLSESFRQPVRDRLRWVLPALVVVLLVAVTLALISLSSTHDADQIRQQQITDTLWVKQTIQFQLDRGVETLQLLAHDIEADKLSANAVKLRLESFMRNAKEAVAVADVDLQATPIAVIIRNGGDITDAQALPFADVATVTQEMKQHILNTGLPRFGSPYSISGGAAVHAYVPAPKGHLLIAVFSFARILEENVPWWFAQENEITLSGLQENLSAVRALAGSGRRVYVHQSEIELPGTSLLLKSNSLKGTPDWIPNLLRASIVMLSAMVILSLWALWRDIRRRVQAEKQLYEEAAFRKAMGDSAVTGLRARDLEGRITFVNPAFCNMVGYSAEELVGTLPPMPYWVPEYREDYQRRVAEVLAGTATKHAFETVFRHRTDKRFPVQIYDAPLIDADGKQTGWMSSIVDVTEQKEAEEKIRTQQERLQNAARLTTLGEIASSLAHELNQPLSAITSYLTGTLNMLASGGASSTEINSVLNKANHQALRAGQIIRRVHDFVRKQEPRREQVILSVLVEDCLPLIELQARPNGIRVITAIAEELPPLIADPVLLQQVLLNLTRNGIEAMATVDQSRRVLEIGASLADSAIDGNMIQLWITDRGTGISDDVRDSLFAAFFTTKAEGMGVGLSICRNIIESHGGRIQVKSPDEGASFCIFLPYDINR